MSLNKANTKSYSKTAVKRYSGIKEYDEGYVFW